MQSQAERKEGDESDRLFGLAGEKYAAVLKIKADDYETLINWGNALQSQAERKEGDESDRLFGLAGEKYVAVLKIKTDDHEALIARNKDLLDGSVPSGNSMATSVLLRLGKLCGRTDFTEAADVTMRAGGALLEQSATAMGQMLLALDMHIGPTPEIVVVGESDDSETATVLDALRRRFVPNRVLAFRSADKIGAGGSAALAGLFEGKTLVPPGPTVYVCENFACREPTSGRDAALAEWEKMAGAT